MNNLMKFAQLLQKRPSDRTIRTLKVIFGACFIALFAAAPQDYTLPYQYLYEQHALITKYVIAGFGILPILSGLSGLCVFKRKTMKRVQLGAGILLFVLGIMISPVKNENVTQAPLSGSASFSELSKSNTAPTRVPVGGLLIILAFLPLFGGITGKCVTEKCLKYKETIKKIRV